ncbi:saccharopine dehydrogenase NADP-binding domain-containing protein [Streptomyces sp. TS71-3]|uniref:saccharopine dehydrogenase NADP-binding domain-containing protein n=1 Tax=Streptomyces sp. TS71-3 TaxID=2733862 RepID=UPI001B162B37|nr:saccharopine dehydrogenase NADP-binding domain-containing protein [Streptomyces sp. TS71-3]GHJ35183.1 epimerase [Streptomyces sp. TS71-3]
MTGRAGIGVLGASGAVGREAVRALRQLGHRGLLLGARRPEALRELAPGSGLAVRVDVRDPASLAMFASSCDLVLNCVGPAYELRATVPAAALTAGAHCVDVGGYEPAWEDLARQDAPDAGKHSVVLSAGTLPGLSGILPRWLAAQGPGSPRALTAYSGGLEPCTPTVAEDVMLSVITGGGGGDAYGESLAAWRNGRRQSRALRIVEDTEAPGFPDRAALQPYLSSEAERLAAHLGLDRADWFNTHPGPRVRTLFGELPGRLAQHVHEADRTALVEEMMLAARLDLAGRTPYYVMDFTLTADGSSGVRRLSLRASSSYRLTALVGALAADAVVRRTVPPGVHFACDVLDPAEVAARLRADETVERFEVSGDAEPALVEEGAL